MTILGYIHSIFGGRNLEEDAKVEREQWRDAIHTNRTEITKALGSSVESKHVSARATQKLQAVIQMQEGGLLHNEKAFIDRLRGDNAR